ncbi:MAG: hypothetical protein IE909_15655 [Campylobacterales bacterium]|nr:hypothetical protein [Campylobacterales bacterium]
MSDLYQTYSSKKPSILSTGIYYGVNEMAETAFSMGSMAGRRQIVEGLTSDIDNQFASEIIQDGLSAGLGYFTGQAMRFQDALLESAYNKTSARVVAWYSGRSFLKDKFRSLKGRKKSLFSKFLGDNNKKVDECRLIADFGKMDIHSSVSSSDPKASHNLYEGRIKQESLEVQKEGVRSSMASLQVEGMKNTFDMKLKTSSFFNTDKDLIRKMTGLATVTDKEIKKLNSLSSSMVFQDSDGNWIGGNQAMIELLSSLRLHRA